MIRSELLKILVCPENQSPLTIASDDLMSRINRAIAEGELENRAGQKLEHPLAGGLLRADGELLYPIVDDIPMMLGDEAVPMHQPALEDR